MKKLLIVGGDSYSDSSFGIYQKFGVEPWPVYLAELNNYELLNTANGGSSNRLIFTSVVDAIMENPGREIVVVVAWSELYRLSFIDDNDIDTAIFLFSDKEHEYRCTLRMALKRYFSKLNPARKEIIKLIAQKCTSSIEFDSKLIRQSFRNIWVLAEFCKSRNIPCYHFHTYDPMTYDYSLSEQMFGNTKKEIRNNIYLNFLEDDKNYIGHDYCLYYDIQQNDFFIENGDVINLHANQEGHRYIASKINNFIKYGQKPEPNVKEKGELYRIMKSAN